MTKKGEYKYEYFFGFGKKGEYKYKYVRVDKKGQIQIQIRIFGLVFANMNTNTIIRHTLGHFVFCNSYPKYKKTSNSQILLSKLACSVSCKIILSVVLARKNIFGALCIFSLFADWHRPNTRTLE